MTGARTTPPTVRLVAVSGGLGAPSSSRMLVDRIVGHAERALLAHGVCAEVEVLELRDLAVPIANRLVTGFAEPALAEALAALAAADGIVAVSPVFNASIAGLFKSFFDLVEADALRGTPVALGATGGSARHSLVVEYAMRPLFSYLRALPMPTGVFAATEDWGAGASEGGLEERAARLARELADAVRLDVVPAEEAPTAADERAAVSQTGDEEPAAPRTGASQPSAARTGRRASTARAGDDAPRASARLEPLEPLGDVDGHDDFAELMARFAGVDEV